MNNANEIESHNPCTPPIGICRGNKRHRSEQQLRRIVEKLRAPFHPAIIQWRVVERTKMFGRVRGRVIPYADKLAYHERLNEVVTPAGWSQSISVQTAPVGGSDRGAGAAKIVVTCELFINALGTHSSTGESWASDENAATSAEAQAFKRSCACFGLGAYLYYFFDGLWVDLDSEQRPIDAPQLPAWATPEGWAAGQRPSIERVRGPSIEKCEGTDPNLIRQIETMHANLGAPVYRRILKGYRVWEPRQLPDAETAQKVLCEMQCVENLLTRAAYAFERLGRGTGEDVLKSFALKSVSDFGDLSTLDKIVEALEAQVSTGEGE